MSSTKPSRMVPIYRQLIEIIQKEIIGENPEDNALMPTEKELEERYSVSRITVRKALAELVKDGAITKIKGKGAFIVGKKINYSVGHGKGFTAGCRLRGAVPSTTLLKIETVTAPKDERAFFGIGEEDEVIMIQRLRSSDGKPCIFETIYLPMENAAFANEPLEGSLYSILKEKYHITPIKKSISLEIGYATAYEAKLMGVKTGEPMILVHDHVVDQNGKPVHTTKMVVSHQYKFFL